MSFNPAEQLGASLDAVVGRLRAIRPDELAPLPGACFEPHFPHPGDAETLEAVNQRPQALMPTVVDSYVPAAHPPITVPDIVLETYLGGGSQGWVYAGKVRSSGKIVAVKMIRSDCGEAVTREVRVCSQLRHYNLLRVFEVQNAGAFWVVLMELIQGPQLGTDAVLPQQFKPCLGALADGCRLLGERGIVHRDVKPSNILVRRQDGSPVLVDFGLAIDLRESGAEQSHSLCGTPFYLPPEAFRSGSTPSPSWDHYALGVTAAVCLAGRFNAPTTFEAIWDAKRSGDFQETLEDAASRIDDPELRQTIESLTSPEPASRIEGLERARQWMHPAMVPAAV